MPQFHWLNAPSETRAQVNELCAGLRSILGNHLTGIYLHGSLAMGCFNPQRSDLDLLVVLSEELPKPIISQVAGLLLDLSQRPHPIEISFLTREQLNRWQYPTPYHLHYSEKWRECTATRLRAGDADLLVGSSPTDPDLAAHFTILHHRGIALAGLPIETVFPAVPAQDYLSSIWHYDMSDCANWIKSNSVYGVLNLCRVLAYVTDSLIVSKDEGGVWALETVPSNHRAVVEEALSIYRGDTNGNDGDRFDAIHLNAFARYMTEQIIRRMDTSK